MRVRPHRSTRSKNLGSRAQSRAQTPWIGAQSNRVNRLRVRRNASSVNTILHSRAEYVTPHLMGGRVAPTNSASAISPWLRVLMTTSDPEKAPHPRNDLRRAERNGDSKDRAETPTPRKSIR